MGKSKDVWITFMESLFSSEDVFFGDQMKRLKQKMKEQQDLDYEEFETRKNGIKTTIKCGFTKDGYLSNLLYESHIEPTKGEEKINQLKLDLEQAKEIEDYPRCAELKRQIEEETKQLETK